MRRAALIALLAFAPVAFAQRVFVRVVAFERMAGPGAATPPDHVAETTRAWPAELNALMNAVGTVGVGVRSIDRFALNAGEEHAAPGAVVKLLELSGKEAHLSLHIDDAPHDFDLRVPLEGTLLLEPDYKVDKPEYVAVSVFPEATADRIPEVFRVGGDVKAPIATTRIEPIYPEDVRQRRITGIVILQTEIDDKENVAGIHVIKDVSGLTDATVEAVNQWRFQPATRNGKPVRSIFNLTVQFKLD